jgi:hypothetical protein
VKSVVQGIFGALLVLVAAFLIVPQYSDYRAASETSGWLIASMPTAQAITDNILRQKTTSGAGIGVPKPAFQFHPPALVEVTPNGTIFLKGGRDGQFVALIPEFSARNVLWRCIGGSSHATRPCQHWRGPKAVD